MELQTIASGYSDAGGFTPPVLHKSARGSSETPRGDPFSHSFSGRSTLPAVSSGRAVSGKAVKQQKTFPNGHSYIGTLVDGRMHGEGLYVWQDGSEYKGEFYNGTISGRGEKQWTDGRCYRGSWKQDMMWGKGEMTWPTGESYSGQFWKGEYHGRGTRIKPSGDKYTGDFNNGEQEGEGTFSSATEGWVFVGLWLHGRMYGEGRVEWPDGTAYVGQWKDGIRDGHGRLEWPDGAWYEGPFRGNHVEGHGLKSFPDGSYYEGQFTDGEFEGQGKFHWPDQTEFEGLWSRSGIVGPGCHRFPNGTTITGTFADCGASGQGQKRWTNGCVYNGVLKQNRIDHYGTLRWPDGRHYTGRFENDMLHGDGMLVWADKGGECTYQGQFERNVFEGHGALQWSSGARYEGSFHNGHYHGEGLFEWPGKRSAYSGQWVLGEMCGRGTLTCCGTCDEISQYVCVGDFRHGHIEGKGHVVFSLLSGGTDEYRGRFKGSKFNGRGTFKWNDCTSLTGLFEDGYCNRLGRKIYPDGREYTGELRYDLEHGKGIQTEPQRKRFVGFWKDGNVVEELFDSCAPEVDLKLDPCRDSSDEECDSPYQSDEQAARSPSSTTPNAGGTLKRTLLPICDESGTPVCGRAIVTFLNGDKYVGYMDSGRKHGRGMYVYADLTMYRGVWSEDVLEGVRHPVSEDPLPVKVKQLVRHPEGVATSRGSRSPASAASSETRSPSHSRSPERPRDGSASPEVRRSGRTALRPSFLSDL